jgi:hypothetical protein
VSYFLGSFITFFLIFATSAFLKYNEKINKIPRIRSSQAYTFIVLKNLIAESTKPIKRKETQATKHDEKTNVRVVFLDRHAYWIKDNSFYMADVDSEGIDGESAQVVDIMGLDKVQLDKMLFIIDQLRDGKEYDSGASGDN